MCRNRLGCWTRRRNRPCRALRRWPEWNSSGRRRRQRLRPWLRDGDWDDGSWQSGGAGVLPSVWIGAAWWFWVRRKELRKHWVSKMKRVAQLSVCVWESTSSWKQKRLSDAQRWLWPALIYPEEPPGSDSASGGPGSRLALTVANRPMSGRSSTHLAHSDRWETLRFFSSFFWRLSST